LFLLITAEIEGCLEGESHVMVPNVGHGVHQNPTFFNPVAIFRRFLLAPPLQRAILGLSVEEQIPISDPARGATRRTFSP
jgi:hypothetical protein